jgi:penicillin V acylase-like amidase (Ntn superfamily)
MPRTPRRLVLAAAFVLPSLAAITPIADACSRAVYFGKEGQTVTGRTMDWVEDLKSNLYLMPRGMQHTSNTKTPFTWTSKHGSVITSIYGGGTADGMNEKGLVANMLYLSESKYPAASPEDKRPTMSVAAWAQYVLDSFATVPEAVEGMKKEPFRLVPVTAPSGHAGTIHLSVSDATGDSAVFEYIDGKLTVHHGREYQVMTNSPTFDKQLPLNEYWKSIGGTVMLPGTNRASDRFARASFYINAVEQSADPREAVAAVFSVMRNVSVPRGISTPGQPNIASTIWRTVSDQKNRVYYFENTFSPSVVWVDLKKLDFSAASGVRMIQLSGNPDVAGNQTAEFKPTTMFKFMIESE